MQKDVFGFDIPVDDVVLMHVLNSQADLLHDILH
jgi:hypothetical protein